MNSLTIPSRERLKGQTIICDACKSKGYCSVKTDEGKIKWVCKATGKRISSCPNPERQKFLSTLYNPFSKKSDILVRHTTRDFWEFRKRHIELLDIEKEIKQLYALGNTQKAMAIVKTFRKPPAKEAEQQKKKEDKKIYITSETYLETAMDIYWAFLKGDKREEWEKRPKTKKARENYKRALERFHDCLSSSGYNPEILPLAAVTEDHLHCWVREVKQRYEAKKTQNQYLNDISTFLSWCSDRGAGPICNALDHVARGKTKGDTTTVSLPDLRDMMELVTLGNGKGTDSWKDGKTGKLITKSKNFYREWLPDGLWLALLLGVRGDEIADFQWKEVHERKDEDGQQFYWIELFDHKHFEAHDEEHYHHIPVYSQTLEILERLGLKDKIGTDGYVLAPQMENRGRVKRVMSEGFRWFWRMKVGDKNSKVTFKTLRSTFITIATILAGDQYDLIQKHTKADTTRKHYFNKSFAVSLMMGQDFFAIKQALKPPAT